MKVELTYQQVEEALQALQDFNVACSLRTKLRLARNMRKLANLRTDKEHVRHRLANEVIEDKSRKPDPGQQGLALSVAEQDKLAPQYEKLMKTVVEFDCHPIYLYDSVVGQQPKDKDHDIDISTIKLYNHLLAALVDIVLFEVD